MPPLAVNLLFSFIKDTSCTKGSQGKEIGWFLKLHWRPLGFWFPASPPFESTWKHTDMSRQQLHKASHCSWWILNQTPTMLKSLRNQKTDSPVGRQEWQEFGRGRGRRRGRGWLGGWRTESGRREAETPSHSAAGWQDNRKVTGMECGQDYQLHMSWYQGKSCQRAGLDLLMRQEETFLFEKKRRSL